MKFEVDLPEVVLERVAERAAAIVLERLESSEPEFLSVGEAAELARCKPQRIYDLRSARVLSRIGDGSRALVSRAELVAHLTGVAPTLPQASRVGIAAGAAQCASDGQSAAQGRSR